MVDLKFSKDNTIDKSKNKSFLVVIYIYIIIDNIILNTKHKMFIDNYKHFRLADDDR